MKEKTRAFLQTLDLQSEDIILVAVSGGRDSVALLLTLWELSLETESFSLAVAHYNHESRGEENQSEEIFVKNLCERGDFLQTLGYPKEITALPCYVGRGNVAQIAQEKKQGFEETARQLRYDFLEKLCAKIGGRYIATAHHGEDNLETFLLHFCRGAGLSGLSAIPPKRNRIIRPFLQVSRGEINDYLQKNQIFYCEDPSNQEEQYRRNFLRHQVLPKLQEVNSQYLAHSMNTISIIREENNFLEKYVRENLPLKVEEKAVSCHREALLSLDSALQPRGLAQLVEGFAPNFSLSRRHLDSALSLVTQSAPSGEVLLGQGLRLGRSYDRIFCEQISQPVPLQGKILVTEGAIWHDWQFFLEEMVYTGEKINPWEELYLPFSQKIWLRSRLEGDLFSLPERPRKSLKKWCIQEKIPQEQRQTLPVFLSDSGEILAVCGLGTVVLPQIGEKIYKLKMKKLERKEVK